MIYLTDEKQFSSLIVDKVIVEFKSDNCHACVLAEPFLLEIENSYPFKIILVDITYNINLMRKYTIKVIPTFVMFEEQKELFRIAGFKNKFDIEKHIRMYR